MVRHPGEVGRREVGVGCEVDEAWKIKSASRNQQKGPYSDLPRSITN
jgi:hypothetical protein